MPERSHRVGCMRSALPSGEPSCVTRSARATRSLRRCQISGSNARPICRGATRSFANDPNAKSEDSYKIEWSCAAGEMARRGKQHPWHTRQDPRDCDTSRLLPDVPIWPARTLRTATLAASGGTQQARPLIFGRASAATSGAITNRTRRCRSPRAHGVSRRTAVHLADICPASMLMTGVLARSDASPRAAEDAAHVLLQRERRTDSVGYGKII